MRKVAVLSAVAVGALAVVGGVAAAGGPVPGLAQGWDGVASPAHGVRYVALPNGRTTTVAVVRLRGGRVVRFRSLRGNLGVPLVAFDRSTGGLTPDGRKLVLASSPWAKTARFVVVDTQTLRARARIALKGSFAFDAVSPDARTLFLIQILTDGTSYRLRAYDVAHRRLLAKPVVAAGEGAEPMRGAPAARRMGPGGRWAFTLYRGGSEPFVHALDTTTRTAVCIDLPREGAKLRLRGWRLVVLTQAGERVATIDTRTMRVIRGGRSALTP